jgi:molecular chaperone DnaK (HSP70)
LSTQESNKQLVVSTRKGTDTIRAVVHIAYIRRYAGVEDVQTQDMRIWMQWRSEAERCKIALSTDTSCSVTLTHPAGTREFQMTREDLQQAAKPFLESLEVPLQRIAQSHNLVYASLRGQGQVGDSGTLHAYAPPPRRVTQLILVGGVTESPVVRAYVEKVVGCKCCQLEGDSRSSVSRGAAIHAALMMGALAGGLELSDGLYVEQLQSRTSGFQM